MVPKASSAVWFSAPPLGDSKPGQIRPHGRSPGAMCPDVQLLQETPGVPKGFPTGSRGVQWCRDVRWLDWQLLKMDGVDLVSAGFLRGMQWLQAKATPKLPPGTCARDRLFNNIVVTKKWKTMTRNMYTKTQVHWDAHRLIFSHLWYKTIPMQLPLDWQCPNEARQSHSSARY